MKFGLTENEFNYFQNQLVNPLINSGATVWVFGSRARGDHQKHSDLDVLVESNTHDLTTTLSKIREVFEEGNFPYKVDIVLLSELAESYRENALQDRIRVHLN